MVGVEVIAQLSLGHCTLHTMWYITHTNMTDSLSSINIPTQQL